MLALIVVVSAITVSVVYLIIAIKRVIDYRGLSIQARDLTSDLKGLINDWQGTFRVNESEDERERTGIILRSVPRKLPDIEYTIRYEQTTRLVWREREQAYRIGKVLMKPICYKYKSDYERVSEEWDYVKLPVPDEFDSEKQAMKLLSPFMDLDIMRES